MTRRELLGGVALAWRKGNAEAAAAIVDQHITSGSVESAALLVRGPDGTLERGFGKAKANTPFLIASITKPMTCSAVLLLRDRGELRLTDPVRKFLPGFAGGERDRCTIQHLLTHTSGLPDMLPENVALRQKHAPLSEFVRLTLTTPLLFAPGERVSYQSMGILLAASIVEKITTKPLREFLAAELFGPLGMRATSLGLGGRNTRDCARVQVDEVTDYDWNSPYWRDLGAPWGGAHSTVADVARLLEAVARGRGPWKAGTTAEMLRVQTPGLNEPWGLGWVRDAAKLGAGCSAETFGHSGSTGTLAWHDPAAKSTFVLFTSLPAARSNATVIQPASDAASRT